MIVNVLTRTSGRPKAFARCRQSILDQEVDGLVCHLVSTDDPADTYVEGDIVVPVVRNGRWSWNDYMNKLMAAVPDDGWIMWLDDDDRFTTPHSLAVACEQITSPDDLLIWKMKFPRRLVRTGTIPRSCQWRRTPRRGDIASACVMFHSKWRKLAHWPTRSCADYYAITGLYSKLRPVWIDAVLTELQGMPGRGKRKDIA